MSIKVEDLAATDEIKVYKCEDEDENENKIDIISEEKNQLSDFFCRIIHESPYFLGSSMLHNWSSQLPFNYRDPQLSSYFTGNTANTANTNSLFNNATLMNHRNSLHATSSHDYNQQIKLSQSQFSLKHNHLQPACTNLNNQQLNQIYTHLHPQQHQAASLHASDSQAPDSSSNNFTLNSLSPLNNQLNSNLMNTMVANYPLLNQTYTHKANTPLIDVKNNLNSATSYNAFHNLIFNGAMDKQNFAFNDANNNQTNSTNSTNLTNLTSVLASGLNPSKNITNLDNSKLNYLTNDTNTDQNMVLNSLNSSSNCLNKSILNSTLNLHLSSLLDQANNLPNNNQIENIQLENQPSTTNLNNTSSSFLVNNNHSLNQNNDISLKLNNLASNVKPSSSTLFANTSFLGNSSSAQNLSTSSNTPFFSSLYYNNPFNGLSSTNLATSASKYSPNSLSFNTTNSSMLNSTANNPFNLAAFNLTDPLNSLNGVHQANCSTPSSALNAVYNANLVNQLTNLHNDLNSKLMQSIDTKSNCSELSSTSSSGVSNSSLSSPLNPFNQSLNPLNSLNQVNHLNQFNHTHQQQLQVHLNSVAKQLNNSNSKLTTITPNKLNNNLSSSYNKSSFNGLTSSRDNLTTTDMNESLNDKNTSTNNKNNLVHIKKPLNAFMLFMRDNRNIVAAESTLKESAAINQKLGKMWQNLPKEDQEKYFLKAKKARELHMRLYPNWSARDNYALNIRKKKKKKKDKNNQIRQFKEYTNSGGSLKKCRARFGVEQQSDWCKPCRRKKKCVRYK